MEKLNSQSLSPLYKQLMDRLYADILKGTYPVNSRIPSEPSLCAHYGVSRVTVRKALAELTDEGLLLRIQGKGTFVAAPKLKRNLRDVTGFSESCRQMGKEPGSMVIHALPAQASLKDAQDLEIMENDPAVELMRLRLSDGMPVMLEKNVFSSAYAFLLQSDLTGSLYDLLAMRHIYPDRATHDISLCHASSLHAKYLEVEPGEALLHLYEVIYDQSSRPIHTSMQFIRGDRFTFRI